MQPMTGNENIKIGDELICIENEGLMNIGDKHTVKGITEDSINTNGTKTTWQKREDFRWSCYTHKPKN